MAGPGRLPADSARGRWSIPSIPQALRVPLPAAGIGVYAGIRVLGLMIAAFLLRHGEFRQSNRSLDQLIIGGDGGFYRLVAAHGYNYNPGQLDHASVLAFLPGYPAAIDSLAWLPGVSIALAGFAVTILAGLAAAWGLATLGMKLTADRRISLLMVALWAVAPGSIALSRVYAEALFCALAVWALVALVDRRWLTAGALVSLAGTVRSTALALIAAVAVAVIIALIQAARTRQPIARWWRPIAALLLAPLGLLGYWGYVAAVTHRLDGWFWIEKQTFHMTFDWGAGTLRLIRGTFLDKPYSAELLVVLAILAAVGLTAWSLTERIPVYLHAYTVVVAFIAFTTSAAWVSSKPRFFLPAVLLALPLARLLAPMRTSVLVSLIAVLTAASTWFSMYLMIIAKWAS
ncbi:MAG: mannosyltransferase family protein [Streptosporangiaceae bacterium]